MGGDPEGPGFVTASPGGDGHKALPPSRSLILAAPGEGPAHPSAQNYQMQGGGGALPALLSSALLLTPFCITWDPCPWLLGECLGNAGYAGEVGRQEERCQDASSSGHPSFTVTFLHRSGSESNTTVSPGLGLVGPARSCWLGSLTPFDSHLPCRRPRVRPLPSPWHAGASLCLPF